jgi:hypothetical protein
MSHREVIRGYIRGRYRRGSRVFADRHDDTLYSYGHHFPLLVRLPDGFLVNGNRYSMSTARHQRLAFGVLAEERQRYAVVPFAALQMANRTRRTQPGRLSAGPLPEQLRAAASIVVPSGGERWYEAGSYRKSDGSMAKRWIHTLGDSVIRVHEQRYVSAVDETGAGRGAYFLAELPGRREPRSIAQALEMLKPEPVREAERQGLAVLRQGEWFAIPWRTGTRRLMRDVRRGLAIRRHHHVLGGDGHHQLTDAVIYKYGPKKGWVVARGTMRHTRGEHRMLVLASWSRIVRARHHRSYSLGGNFD